MVDRKRSKSLLERAYDLQTGDEALSLYRDWATSYDTDLVDPLGYVGPARLDRLALRGDKARQLDRRSVA